jgi:hypothetical protein
VAVVAPASVGFPSFFFFLLMSCRSLARDAEWVGEQGGGGGEERGGGCAANNFGDPFVFFFW